MIYTTLNKIREHEPCTSGWKKLLSHLGKTQSDDEPLSLLTLLESNGLDDALWCLRAVDGIEKDASLFAIACARRVQHLMKDHRSIEALDVAERYALGNATYEELKSAVFASAWAVSVVADGSAAWAANDAADSTKAAAESAPWVARVVAKAAWRAAACAAARCVEIKWQEEEFRRVFCNDKAEGRS